MISALAFVLSCLPQDPSPAQLLRGVHLNAAVDTEVAVVEKALVGTPDGAVPGIATLPLARQLRQSGIDAIDVVGSTLAFSASEQRLEDVVALTRAAWGFQPSVARPEPRPGVQELERVCSRAYLDLVQALGSGRNLSEVAPELHAAVDQVRKSIENLDELSGDAAELLTARLERTAKVENDAIHDIAETIVRTAIALDRDDFRDAMKRQAVKSGRNDGATTGDLLFDRDTTFGRMVVGGFGRNVYDCSKVEVILDVGGDDEYRGDVGGAGERRRLAVVIDLDGADRYEGGNDTLGSATFGIGLLVDLRGDDHYSALSRSGGFGLAGVGVLLDAAGDDQYEFGDQSGGVGLVGSGLMLDLGGADDVAAGVQSLGCGLPGGFGLCFDGGGDDVRRLGVEPKRVADARDASAQTTDRDARRTQDVSVGLGAGIGALPLLSGGVGAFVDLGGGSDSYRSGGLALGVGIRGGVGLFRDGGGDDTYRAGDVALGAAYAHGLGVMIDGGGADQYEAGHLALGAASGHGVGLFLDVSGDDVYSAVSPSLGGARRCAVGGFVDLAGADQYTLRRGAAEWRVIADETEAGVAIGVFLHLGAGTDSYSFDRLQEPENDRTRRVDGGDDTHPHRHFFVDR